MYEVAKLEFFTRGVPQDCDVLILAGPSRDLLPEEWASLDRYLVAGGKVLVMSEILGSCMELSPYLDRFNIQVKDEVLYGGRFRSDLSPIVPRIKDFGNHEITDGFKSANLPMHFYAVNPVEIGNKPVDGISAFPLVMSSEEGLFEIRLSKR